MMKSITQAILNQSKLEVDLIKITNATKDSFLMSINAKVTKIGITTAHMSEMTVDMVGPRGAFGRLEIPPAKVGPSGGNIAIVDQTVQILDMEAFKAFVKSIMQDEQIVLRLDNGKATIKALGRSSNIIYRKDILVRGLKGLQVSLVETEPEGPGFKSTLVMVNPSPFEIDIGTVKYQVQDENGAVIGEQVGATYIKREESRVKVTGPITGKVSNGQARFIGVDVQEENWFKEVMAAVDIIVSVPDGSAWHSG